MFVILPKAWAKTIPGFFKYANDVRNKGFSMKRKILAAEVNALLLASGWSTQELAGYLGVTVRAVQMWKNGGRTMPLACFELALLRSRVSGHNPAEREKIWQQFIEDAERFVWDRTAQEAKKSN